MTTPPLPLAGLRVLDIATFIAAPFAAASLAEFGAEVIKIEQPGKGDSLRQLGTPSEAGDTYWWLSDARNKHSITLDLRTERGADLFRQLVATADILVENFRPGTLEKWGLGWEELQRVNPRLILLRISAYGQTGPKRELPGFARIAHAFCGLTHLVGTPDSPPLIPGSTTLADYLSGIYGAFGIMLALRSRDQTGRGQMIDVGLYEPMFRFLDEMAPVYEKTGKVRQRAGMDAPNACPHSHFPAADGKWVAIACTNDRMFARLCEVMGKPELAQPDAYATYPQRNASRAEINRIVGEWSGALPQKEVIARCSEGEVPCGPIHTIEDIFADSQFAARDNLKTVPDERIGSLTVANVVPRLSETPGAINHLGPELGNATQRILGEELGLSREELEKLKEEGVI